MREFLKLDGYGQLYVDQILFESYFPIIFTCIDDNRNIFICVCCQNNEKGIKWLVGKTKGNNIVKMLRDEITVRQLLLEYSSSQVSVDYVKDEYKVDYNSSDWNENSIYLPKEDFYMDAEEDEFAEEISYFLSMDSVPYDNEYYKQLVNGLSEIEKEIEPTHEALGAVFDRLGKIKISSEITRTLEVAGQLYVKLAMATEKYEEQERYRSVLNNTFHASNEQLKMEIDVENCNFADAA